MRHLKSGRLSTVRADQQPASQALIDIMLRVASCLLHGLDKLCLDISKRKRLKRLAPLELPACCFERTGVAAACDLGVDPIQAPFGSHKR